jgi:hypothetical protein
MGCVYNGKCSIPLSALCMMRCMLGVFVNDADIASCATQK